MAVEFQRQEAHTVHQGRLISVEVATFLGPDGDRFERDIVRHPGSVSVVPVIEGSQAVLMVRQYRAAVGRELLEIPAGVRDVDGEPPEVTARRELEEEAAMRAGHLRKLVEFLNSPGFCDEHSVIYLACDLEPCEGQSASVEERYMTVETIALADVPMLVADGAIVDAKSIIGLCLTREALG
jgi:8-oxo-dGTP pyrophosphatase MutT (NUDIX family)